MHPPVDSLLPLSFLEAVRGVDLPNDDAEAELVPELRNKRLGLSDTVYAQIRRYTDLARRKQRVGHDEAVALARLIGRRPDHDAVFRRAGTWLAERGCETIPAPTRWMMRSLPALVARPLALRHTRRLAARYVNGEVTRMGASLFLVVDDSVTLEAAPKNGGCVYYESWLRETLERLVGATGAIEHVRCAGRQERTCEWRAEWR